MTKRIGIFTLNIALAVNALANRGFLTAADHRAKERTKPKPVKTNRRAKVKAARKQNHKRSGK